MQTVRFRFDYVGPGTGNPWPHVYLVFPDGYAPNFGPEVTGWQAAVMTPGKVVDKPNAPYDHEIAVSLPDSVVAAMEAYYRAAEALKPPYAAFGFNCVDMLIAAMTSAGADSLTISALMPDLNLVTNALLVHISYFFCLQNTEWGFDFAEANAIWKSPIVLDLDGDGFETVGIDPNNPIYFDHDGDGVLTVGGWLAPDDAFLVLDRNANGTIDSGRELFGDSTPLPSGGTAADGFAALVPEDTDGDGLLTSSDAGWANLGLWRDMDQDGVSDPGELFTLASAGITAIRVGASDHSEILLNGNRIDDLGTFERSDGIGTIGQSADIYFIANTFLSQFSDRLAITPEAQSLPDAAGAGQVRTLREAVSVSQDLQALLSQFASETLRSEQLGAMPDILRDWSDTSELPTTFDGAYEGHQLTVVMEGVPAGTPEYDAWAEKLSVLERFNGRTINAVPSGSDPVTVTLTADMLSWLEVSYNALHDSVYAQLVLQTRLSSLVELAAVVQVNGRDVLDLSPMEQELSARIVTDPMAGLGDLLDMTRALYRDPAWNGWGMLADYLGSTTMTPEVDAMLAALGISVRGQAGFSAYGSIAGDVIAGDGSADLLNGLGGDDALLGQAGNDTLYGVGGNDALWGGAGNDVLLGGAGDDVLTGGLDSDTLEGGAGGDVYRFGLGDGQDVIRELGLPSDGPDSLVLIGLDPSEVTLSRPVASTGGTGNVRLTVTASGDQITLIDQAFGNYLEEVVFEDGTVWDQAALRAAPVTPSVTVPDPLVTVGISETFDLRGNFNSIVYHVGAAAGSKTYLWDANAASDLIQVYGGGSDDTVRIIGLTPSQVTVTRPVTTGGDSSTFVLSASGSTLSLVGQFGYGYEIERVVFDDGTVWDQAALRAAPITPTVNDPNPYVTAGIEETFDLRGSFNSTIYYIAGAAGRKTYLWGADSGIDQIRVNGGSNDTVSIAGLATSEVSMTRPVDASGNAYNVALRVNGTADRLYLNDQFNAAYVLEAIRFDDGTVWDQSQTKAAPVTPSASGTIYANGLNDETIDLSGTFNSYLLGASGTGNDIYWWGAGAGQDTINDYSTITGNADIVLIHGLSVSQVTMIRPIDGTGHALDVRISENGTSNQLLLKTQRGYVGYEIESIRFDDGTTWDNTAIKAAPMTPTAAGTIYGLGSADTLDLRGSFNTTAYGGYDTSQTNSGDDTFWWGGGAGQDTINDYSTLSGNSDTVLIHGLSVSQVAMIRPIDGTGHALDVRISESGTGNHLTLKNQRGYVGYEIESVRFDDGTTWDNAAIMAAPMTPTAAGTIYGQNSADNLDLRGSFNTTAYGGYDTSQTNSGDDTFWWSRGAGQDVVYDYGSVSGNTDTVRLIGLATSEVSLVRNGNDSLISISGSSDTLRLKNQYSNSAYTIERIVFDDGAVWSATETHAAQQQQQSRVAVVFGTSESDLIDLRGGSVGHAYGYMPSPVESGADTYLVGATSSVVIDDFGAMGGDIDVLQFDDSVSADRLAFSRRGNDLVVQVLDTEGKVTVSGWYSGQDNRIEIFRLADGREVGSSQVEQLTSDPADLSSEFRVELVGFVQPALVEGAPTPWAL